MNHGEKTRVEYQDYDVAAGAEAGRWVFLPPAMRDL